MEAILNPLAAVSINANLAPLVRAWDLICTLPHLVFDLYVSEHPLTSVSLLVLFVAASCFFVSVFSGNCSQVDRLWSFLPFLYCWYFAAFDYLTRGVIHPRLLLLSILTTLWGLRLTFNFARKGGYDPHDEDYRWPVLRKLINNYLVFQLFNLTFISFYQNVLLFLLAAPAYIVLRARNVSPSLNSLDYAAAALFLLLLAIETVADQQQWSFQQKKHALIAAKKPLTGDYKRGFITTGLFAYSRHPNFFAEQLIWWAVYLFSVAATGVYFNWTISGAFLLTLLFQGSTSFTEKISAKKYADYAHYQRLVSRLIPSLPGRFPNSKEQ